MTATKPRKKPAHRRTPCKKCPFRTDVTPYLRPSRAREIAKSIREGAEFPCHETTVPDPDNDAENIATSSSQACAGALIIQEKQGSLNQLARISERIGLYDRDAMRLDAPVYASFADWVRAHDPDSVQTVTSEYGEVLEYEHCGVVGPDCGDPAGYSIGGGAAENEEPPTCNPLTDTCQCGTIACQDCRVGTDELGQPICINCDDNDWNEED